MRWSSIAIGSGSAISTPAPTTRRPAARSNTSTRRSSDGSAKQDPASTIEELQAQLDRFRAYYNEIRPHRAIGRRVPAEAYAARPKDHPRGPVIGATYRVRKDRIDTGGAVTLRHHSKLLHINVGRRHAGVRVLMLVAGLDERIVTEDGELIRALTIDP